MNQHLQTILNLIQQSQHISEEEKTALIKATKDAGKEIEIVNFKLDRTEKVKRTTAILLEETIEELGQKRKAVEAQNRELEIEASLEKVRSRTMAMQKSDELNDVAALLFKQVKDLGIKAWTTGFNVWIDGNDAWIDYITTPQGNVIESYIIDATKFSAFTALRDARKRNEKFWIQHLNGDELKGVHQQLVSFGNEQYKKMLETGFKFPAEQYNHFVFGPNVSLMFNTYEPVPGAHDIFKRFGKVFEQTYTRFLDLQKAEAQSRESQIQLALERVRARTMAMQHSEELTQTAALLFHQVKLLDLPVISCGFNIWAKEDNWCQAYMSDEAGFIQPPFKIPLTESPAFIHFAESKRKDESFYAEEVKGDALKQHYEYMLSLPVFAEIGGNFSKAGFSFPVFQINNVANFNFGNLIFITAKDIPEAHEIFKRFAKTFEQTYTRFLDLQKAEAQAREARIEIALESVRSASLAMHHSNQLKAVATVMFKKFTELGLTLTGAFIFLFDSKTRDIQLWISTTTLSEASDVNIPYTLAISSNSIFKDLWKIIEEGHQIFNRVYSGKEKNDYFSHVGKYNIFPQEVKDFHQKAKSWITSIAGEKHAAVGFDSWDGQLASAEDFQILKRFSKAFEQAYVRFLDLQKAEAQAREAQVETALEKIRGRSLAMHQSGELKDVIKVMFEKLRELNVLLGTVAIWLFDKTTMNSIFWVGNDLQEPALVNLPYDEKLMEEDTNYKDSWQAWLSGEDYINKEYSLEQKNRYFNYVFANNNFNAIPAPVRETILQEQKHIASLIVEKNSSLFVDSWSGEVYSEASINVLKRIAKVFEQAYTRFLDLQKSEAQSRESQIELSLERLRAKTMAMHNSTDVGETAAVMVEELKKLDIETIRCGIGIMHEPGDMEVWTISTDANNKTDIIIGWLDMNMHPLLHGAFESWRNKLESYAYELKDEDLFNYYDAINKYPGYPIKYDTTALPNQINHNEFHFTEGTLFAFSLQQLTSEQKKIFRRFAGVFGQTYRRYLDLQKAESQAREAKIETALERVRSRTLAMQKSEELAATAAVLFQQLIGLGIEPNRLYISIMRDDRGEAEFWITGEDGSKVSSAYTDNLNTNASFKKMYDGWKEGKSSLIIDMQGKELQDYFQHLTSLNVPFKEGLFQKRRIQHLAYFNRGFIGMAAPDDQPAETIHLLERFAAVFNLTFTRFNDLKIAEAHAVQAGEDLVKLQTEKRRAEDALSELQVTQRQLIQSEKMASLGELTAGIAHEIQNPLNFVNNFSEVSKELLAEMNEALESGDEKEAMAIAKDVIQNLEKINHHGKRADAIVKGMLQHSRKDTGIKEPTDINALCDEYLRLSYHGLRAKDKSFNADFRTHFDESIGKINVVPQDIGRVMLNLFNNAFYAVSKPPSTKGVDYKPLVSVQTKWLDNSPPGDGSVGKGSIEIIVADNGNGIPQNIIDKIFQPFFTTKPTGSGTGLGLSLAFDIITKEHNGMIKVESIAGEGAALIIQIPNII